MGVRLLWCLFIITLLGTFTPRAAWAGTTGGLSGTVRDSATGAGLAGVHVNLTSASQNAQATTDGSGHFTFVSLAPDTYAVSLELQGYDVASVSGVTVTADARQTVSFNLRHALKTIGRTTSRNAADLVRPGTTADVYSINARQQDVLSSLGGGGNLDTAYSAIGSVAGAYVPAGESGYNQAVFIRGGDAGEVGFEFDGIPVNRGFDNYPGGSLSSLGQLELQVYTGASPANAEAQGLAGFVNQVIRSGSYPSSSNVNFDLGGPSYFHTINLETGGANPARTFSYYVGLGGYNQDFRYIDQYNGASSGNLYGPILYSCPTAPTSALPSCFTNGVPNVGQAGASGFVLGTPSFASSSAASVTSRSSIVNVHFGIPHGEGLKDDVQLLYDNNEINTQALSSPQEFGAANIANFGQPSYTDSWQYSGALGTLITNPAQFNSKVAPYLFPSSSPLRAFDGPIPGDMRDTQLNGQGIFKLQYQRNFDTRSYLRLYGYTYYSDYIAAGPNSSFQQYTGIDSGDYELNSHTRGVSATYANQLSQKHLLEAQASYTMSTALRSYNQQMFGKADNFAVVVNPADVANPAAFNGTCYRIPGAGNGTLASPTTCNPGSLTVRSGGGATFATLSGIGCQSQGKGCTNPPQSAPADLTGLTCGTGSCAYYVAENGAYGEYNHVKPAFSGFSLTDTWKPSDRVTVTAGLRLDQYRYTGDNTDTGPARAFWYAAFNNDTCYDTATLQLVDKTNLFGSAANPTAAACSSAGSAYAPVNMVNSPSQQFVYNVLQPRLGATYSLGADTVLRASFGKYDQQPSSAYSQYDAYQQNLPATLTGFYSYGFNTPGHQVRPEISYNSDFSLEHHVRGTDISFKLSPFLRQTKDQLQNFYLDVKSGLVSGLNVGQQTSDGFELEISKGDFARNGFAAQLSFAYTNAYIKYRPLANGTTILSPINADISTYNAYTKGCTSGGAFAAKTQYGAPICGSTSNGSPAAPCYTPTGVPDATCALTSFANPYWNAPTQGLFNPTAAYAPYSIFPGAIGTGDNSYTFPYVATMLLNYRHDKFAITPMVQFQAGNRYGSPETTPGIDPGASCTPLAGSSAAGDPRYPYGAPGGSAYDATTCAAQLNAIPNPYTQGFDGIGAFRQPAQIVGNLRLSYDLTKRVQLVATLANVINRCFGGQKTAFTYNLSPQVCSYTSLVNSSAPVGNVYNPGDNIQTFQRYPYEPFYGPYNDLTGSFVQPFSVYVSARLRL